MSTRLTKKTVVVAVNQPRKKKRTQKKKTSSAKFTTVTQAPVSKSFRVKGSSPTYTSLSGGNIRVSHRELFADLLGPNGSPAWNLKVQLPINPGNEDLFPWLSAIAERFESYRFHKLQFEYLPMLGTAEPGVVEMAIDYDATDAPPASKIEMMSYKGFQRVSIWDGMSMKADPVDLNKIGPSRYVLGDPVPAGTDAKTYNVGQLLVAITGNFQPGTTAVGELYVHYDVELQTPQFHSFGTGSVSDVTPGRNSATETLALIPATNFTPMGVQNPIALVTPNSFRVTDPGRYLVEMNQTFSTAATPGALADVITAIAPNTYANQGVAFVNGTTSAITGILNIAQQGANLANTLNLAGAGTGTLTSNFVRLAEYSRGA